MKTKEERLLEVKTAVVDTLLKVSKKTNINVNVEFSPDDSKIIIDLK